MTKVLVTGGCGFVGRHLIQRLLVENYEVHCVDVIAPLSGAVEPNNWPLFNPLTISISIIIEKIAVSGLSA